MAMLQSHLQLQGILQQQLQELLQELELLLQVLQHRVPVQVQVHWPLQVR